MSRKLCLAFMLFLCWTGPLRADQQDWLDDFDDLPEITVEVKSAQPRMLYGEVKLCAAWDYNQDRPQEGGVDHRGLSRFRLETDLKLDTDLPADWHLRAGTLLSYDLVYRLQGRDDYPDEVLDEGEARVELTDTYVEGPLGGGFSLKIGRQVVAWGAADNIRVLDRLNPLDLREPGLVDIEDLRLPVTMTRLDCSLNPRWEMSGILIHELRFPETPPYGSPYYPAPVKLPHEKEPPNTWRNQEYALNLSGHLDRGDVSLNAARIFDDAAWFNRENLVREHARISLVGGMAQVVQGDWIIKGETAVLDGLNFSNAPGDFTRYDLLLGVEYGGFADTTLCLEVARLHLHDYDGRLRRAPDGVRRDESITSLRLERDFLHETLTLTMLATFYGSHDGFGRLQAEYDVDDSLSVTGGLVLYQGDDDGYWQTIEDNDRLFMSVSYGF